MSERAVCGARRRGTTDLCKGQPMANGRCRIHGGTSLAGAAAPAFRTGRHSKYLPAHLVERYTTAREDPDLVAVRDELALIDVRIDDLLGSLLGADDPATVWAEVRDWVEQRRKLVETERRRLEALQATLTAEQALVLLAAVQDAVRTHVHDRDTLAAIGRELTRLAGGPARLGAERHQRD